MEKESWTAQGSELRARLSETAASHMCDSGLSELAVWLILNLCPFCFHLLSTAIIGMGHCVWLGRLLKRLSELKAAEGPPPRTKQTWRLPALSWKRPPHSTGSSYVLDAPFKGFQGDGHLDEPGPGGAWAQAGLASRITWDLFLEVCSVSTMGRTPPCTRARSSSGSCWEGKPATWWLPGEWLWPTPTQGWEV